MNALRWSNGELFSGCSSMQKVLMPIPRKQGDSR